MTEKKDLKDDLMATICPIMSTMVLVPDQTLAPESMQMIPIVKPSALHHRCLVAQCGWWKLCPANKDSVAIGLITKNLWPVVAP